MGRKLFTTVMIVGIFLIAGAVIFLMKDAPATAATPTEACVSDCPSPSPVFISSYGGTFQLSYTSDVGTLPINQMHTWTLHVETADGQPVEDALIKVDGGMPGHNHGLPTSPAVTMYLGDGNYRVEGIKFHMRGDWVMNFEITASGVTDSAQFDLVVK